MQVTEVDGVLPHSAIYAMDVKCVTGAATKDRTAGALRIE